MRYAPPVYPARRKLFKICVVQDESPAGKGTAEVRTEYPLMAAAGPTQRLDQPKPKAKQVQRVKPEVGQKRPLQNLEPAFIPNVAIPVVLSRPRPL